MMLTEEARQYWNQYKREWYKRNKEKQKKYNESYLIRKAEEQKKEQKNGTV